MSPKDDVRFSTFSFLLGSSVLLVHKMWTLLDYGPDRDHTFDLRGFVLVVCYALFAVGVVWFGCCSSRTLEIAIGGCLLGLVFGASIILGRSSSTIRLVGWFVAAVAFFHWSEYIATGVTNPQNLRLSSYLLNHSRGYHMAMTISVVEFLVEWYFYPDWKQPNALSLLGLSVVMGGETLRKLAMWQASTNFDHHIRYRREDDHRLVTDGVYAWARHPAYVGWFYWSIATQVMILNPFCTLLFAVCTWIYFSDRVDVEEQMLLSFFGDEYRYYQENVGTGLPFIAGYALEIG